MVSDVSVIVDANEDGWNVKAGQTCQSGESAMNDMQNWSKAGVKESTKIKNNASSVVVIGKESVGKSQLVASLTRRYALTGNFRGTTVSCEKYSWDGLEIIDTPGILRESDSETTRLALEKLHERDIVLLLLNATHLDQDLDDLLPLVEGKKGAIVVTFWDMVKSIDNPSEALGRIEKAAGLPLIGVDSRHLSDRERQRIQKELLFPKEFPKGPLEARANWRVEPKKTIFEIPVVGQIVSTALLLVPAWIAVQNANSLADWLYDPVSSLLSPILKDISNWPAPLNYIFGGDYGFVAMLPFLFLYAVPTVIAFAVILSAYKTSGLIDRLTVAMHPVVRPFGLTGRDLVRVIMGFGCNVPAVINSRSCSVCSRGVCISGISFGAACSYQLPATIAVFTAAGMGYLTLPYLLLLAVTTLVYLRFTAPKIARSAENKLMLEGRAFMQWPSFSSTFREASFVMYQFVFKALPIFFGICLIAALLAWSGVLESLSRVLTNIMAIFNLPGSASVAVILGSIRKDGIAIGLLNSDWETLKIPLDTPIQVLTIVYLAGVFLPCLVTLFAISRELKWKFALKMAARQAGFALIFALLVAWVGKFVFG